MDHSIEELDVCVFDYLCANPETPKTFSQIYNAISGEVGHRCSVLQDQYNRTKYKDKFMTICYTLDTKWDNIHKLFLTNDAIPHLVFSSKPHYEVINNCNIKSDLYDTIDTNDLDNVITYMIHNHSQIDYRLIDNNLMQYLVGKNKTDELSDVLKMYTVDLSDVDKLVDITVINNNAKQVKILLDKKMESSNLLLENNIKQLESSNALLLNNVKDLNDTNNKLTMDYAISKIENQDLVIRNDMLSKLNSKLIHNHYEYQYKSKIYMGLLFFGMIFVYFFM